MAKYYVKEYRGVIECGGGDCPWWGQDCNGCFNAIYNEVEHWRTITKEEYYRLKAAGECVQIEEDA